MAMDESMTPTPKQQGYELGPAAQLSGAKYQDKSDAIHKGALGHDAALLVAALIKAGLNTTELQAVSSYIRIKKDMYKRDKEV